MAESKSTHPGYPAWELPSGLTVRLVVGGNPADADVAVCSIDFGGNPGLLNRMVLMAAGHDPIGALPSPNELPVSLVRGGNIPVLIIATIPAELDELARYVRQGLVKLSELPDARTVWFPLIGTGARRLSFADSAMLILDALRSWEPTGRLETVLLSAPDDAAARQVVRCLSEHELDGAALGANVSAALQAARVLADRTIDGIIDAGDALLGALAALSAGDSSAFATLAALVPLTELDEVRAARSFARPCQDRMRLLLSPALARALTVSRRYGWRAEPGAVIDRD